ncbi:hypothetical protein BUY85_00580 [Staphylococcus equorum]|nr:hypothetical protein BUY85_00580 [Staphylococcus equorum]
MIDIHSENPFLKIRHDIYINHAPHIFDYNFHT